jgi:hypothetical protein
MKVHKRAGAVSPRKGAFAALVAALLMVGLLVGVPFVCGQRQLFVTTDGIIVDKRMVLASRVTSYVLVIRSADGEQLSVPVPVQLYRKASVGMHAVKKSGHLLPDLVP